jgi:hypothetical protein
MRPITLTALLLLIGPHGKIAPEKTVPYRLSMTAAESIVAGRAEPVAAVPRSPLPARQCGSCHARHFEEWRRSFHARSLSSENFIKSFARYLESLGKQAREDPQSSMACLACHAPLLKNAEPEVIRQVSDFIVAEETQKLDGFEVGCVACHLDGDRVFAGPIAGPQNNPFHLSKFSTSYKDASFCANCHTSAPPVVPCSDVYRDWKKSRSAKQGTTCQSCHMAERNGVAASGGPPRKIHSHVFPGGRSATMLRQAVLLRLKAGFRGGRLEVTATVRNLTPHRVPDG